MSSHDDDQDDRHKLKYDCKRGPAFRKFRRDFLTVARGKFSKDDRYSFYKTYMRLDEGGTGNNAPAFPGQAGGAGGGVNPAHTAARTKQSIRHGQAYTFLYERIEDERVQQLLADLADTNPAELPADAWDLIV